MQLLPQGPTRPPSLAWKRGWLKNPVKNSVLSKYFSHQVTTKTLIGKISCFGISTRRVDCLFLGTAHILNSVHPTKNDFFQVPLWPSSIASTEKNSRPKKTVLYFSKVCKVCLIKWSKCTLPALRPLIIYPLQLGDSPQREHSDICTVISSSPLNTPLGLTAAHLDVCTWKQKGKIWIYYALIYGPMIQSGLGLGASECAFRQPHLEYLLPVNILFNLMSQPIGKTHIDNLQKTPSERLPAASAR